MEYSSPEEILLAQRAIADSAAMTPAPQAMPPEVGTPPSSGVGVVAGAKKPGLGVLYSLIVPGAGHLYAGSKRGWINIGVDVVSWVAYLRYHDLGKAKEDEYQNYADAHWSRDLWYKTGTDSGGTCAQCNYGTDEDKLLTNFFNNNRQQYYEEIGKIATYFGGWDDYNSAVSDPKFTSANRRYYKGVRDHSNNFLKNADYGIASALVNRVVSAVDVFRMLKRRTMPMLGQDTQLRLHLRTRPFSDETRVGFEIRKRL